jgi:hypothetical protein
MIHIVRQGKPSIHYYDCTCPGCECNFVATSEDFTDEFSAPFYKKEWSILCPNCQKLFPQTNYCVEISAARFDDIVEGV